VGNSRSFHFRQTSDPYRILVTEMLLRQTRARQVESVYEEFFRRYPTVRELAHAKEASIRHLLKPLGLRTRAGHLLSTAKRIVVENEGRVPSDLESLRRLPGVGDYVASCVMSFAYGVPMVAADTNVTRVLSRVVGLSDTRGSASRESVLRTYSAMAELTPRKRDLHYALLDLANAVCRVTKPRCQTCCLHSVCKYPTQPD